MAEKPNPFLLPSQQQPNFNIKGIPADSQYAQAARQQAGISEADFEARMRALRQAGFSQDVNVPWEQQNYVEAYPGALGGPEGPEAHPYVQSTFEQGTQAATARGDDDAYNARVDQFNRENPGGPQMFRKISKHPQMRTAEFTRTTPDFTSRGPITPPANTGGDPRAVSSYPQINEYMTRDRSGAVRLPYDDTSGEQDTAGQRGDYGDKGFGFFGPDATPQMFDPLLIEGTPPPRTLAQIGDSVRMKAQTGQPLDAEERLAYSNHIRKGLQDAGKTEEEIQRTLSRIDPATGMIPPRIR